MANETPPQRDENYCTAIHEAGHAVAAIFRDIDVGRVNIIGATHPDGRPGLGFNEVAYPQFRHFFGKGGDMVRPILVTLFAGPYAEECFDPAVTARTYSFQEDIDMADRYAHAAFRPVVLPTNPDELQAAKERAIESVNDLKMRAIEEAEQFVKTNRPVIEAVAAALVEKGELTGEEIRRIIRERLG